MMQKPFSAEDLAEIDSDAYFTAIEALERAEAEARAQKINRAEIARRLGMDRGTVTKILNGTHRNITLKTLFGLMRAMNRKAFIISKDISSLSEEKPNFYMDQCETFVPAVIYNHQFQGSTEGGTYTYITAGRP